MICKNFLLFCGLSCHFIDGILWSTKVFKFDRIQFISIFFLLLVLLVSCLSLHFFSLLSCTFSHSCFQLLGIHWELSFKISPPGNILWPPRQSWGAAPVLPTTPTLPCCTCPSTCQCLPVGWSSWEKRLCFLSVPGLGQVVLNDDVEWKMEEETI